MDLRTHQYMCLHIGMGSRRTSLDKDEITKNKTSIIHNVGNVFPIQLSTISLATGLIKFKAAYSRRKLTYHFLSILAHTSKCKYLFL